MIQMYSRQQMALFAVFQVLQFTTGTQTTTFNIEHLEIPIPSFRVFYFSVNELENEFPIEISPRKDFGERNISL